MPSRYQGMSLSAAAAAIAAVGIAVAVAGLPQTAGLAASPNSKRRPSPRSNDGRGRDADVPEAIPAKGLLDVFWRTLSEVSNDRVMLVAAGVTFYLLLALFPALAALVSLYGLLADPGDIARNLQSLSGILPPGTFDILSGQIDTLVQNRNGSLGFAFFIGLAVALWSAHSGTLAIFDAMNVAYDEDEKRGFVKLNLLGLGFTLCALIIAIVMVSLVGVMPAVLSYVWLDHWTETLALILRWPLLLLVVLAGVMAIYRFGPSRDPARFRWMTWGAALTALGWLAMSFGFSYYLQNFADYNATYGALGAVIGLLIWTWLSVAILIIGAELNSELEHQTARDTTTGKPRPMGIRNARMADTLGEARA